MPRWASAIAQIRLRGFDGIWDLLRSNLYARESCIRVRIDLSSPEAGGLSAPDSLRVERGRIEALDEIRTRAGGANLPPSFFVDRTHGLRRFYMGFWGGEAAHILWIARAGDACTVSDLRLRPDEVEFRNVHTLEAFRRRGIFAHVASHALRDLRGEGVATAFAHINDPNRPSLQAFKSAGFVPRERVAIRRVFGLDSVRTTPWPPTLTRH